MVPSTTRFTAVPVTIGSARRSVTKAPKTTATSSPDTAAAAAPASGDPASAVRHAT